MNVCVGILTGRMRVGMQVDEARLRHVRGVRVALRVRCEHARGERGATATATATTTTVGSRLPLRNTFITFIEMCKHVCDNTTMIKFLPCISKGTKIKEEYSWR